MKLILPIVVFAATLVGGCASEHTMTGKVERVEYTDESSRDYAGSKKFTIIAFIDGRKLKLEDWPCVAIPVGRNIRVIYRGDKLLSITDVPEGGE